MKPPHAPPPHSLHPILPFLISSISLLSISPSSRIPSPSPSLPQGLADQEALIELKVARELFEQLMNAVQPLQEDGAVLVRLEEGASQSKLVAKGQPLTLNQELESLNVIMVMKRDSCHSNLNYHIFII